MYACRTSGACFSSGKFLALKTVIASIVRPPVSASKANSVASVVFLKVGTAPGGGADGIGRSSTGVSTATGFLVGAGLAGLLAAVGSFTGVGIANGACLTVASTRDIVSWYPGIFEPNSLAATHSAIASSFIRLLSMRQPSR